MQPSLRDVLFSQELESTLKLLNRAPAAELTRLRDELAALLRGTSEFDLLDHGGQVLQSINAELGRRQSGPKQSRKLPSISDLANSQPRRLPASRDGAPSAQVSLTAAGGLEDHPAGQEVDLHSMAQSAGRVIERLRRDPDPRSDGEKVLFACIRTEYPDHRTLSGYEASDRDLVLDVVGSQAITASGGVCGPVAVDYSVATIATAARPVKNALAVFGASRGGLRYILPHTLAAVTTDAPASVWTEATDASPGGSTKPHATFMCQSVQEQYVDAVTSIVQFGNFQARYFPEQIEQYMETVDAVHARLAESTLLAAMSAASSVETYGNYELGASRDFLAAVDRAASQYRYTNRVAPAAPLRLIAPAYLVDMIRTDLARNLPGDSGGQTERLGTTQAEVESWLSARNINVSWTPDSLTTGNGYAAPTGGSAAPLQGFVAPPAAGHSGQLPPWPARTQAWLFHEGAFVFLDGGELNLGMVRDSTLNKTNDFQMFSETFEKVILRGHASYQLDLTIAPTGATVGTVASTTETLGS